MKSKSLLSLLIAFLFAFSSCQNIVEEITINEDGSGTYNVYSDMIPGMAKTASQMAIMFSDMGEEKLTEAQIDSIEASALEKVMADFPAYIDSTINTQDQLPEEVLNDPEKMKMMDKMRVYMTGGTDVGKMDMGMSYAFENVEDLNKFMEMAANMEDETGSNPMTAQFGGMMAESESTFSFDGNRLKRNFKILKKGTIPDDQKEMLMQMTDGGKVQTIITLPKSIKKVKGSNVSSKKDNVLVFEYDMMDYLTGAADLSFDAKLKK